MLTCATCGAENPPQARFCLNCGQPLAASEPARRERKYATALFADLVGSTTLAEREDPEVVQSVVGRTFDRLAQVIARYEGLLEKFMGDAVLAVFGVPRAHEDDAERAVRAGNEMQAVLSELNRGFAAEGKPELSMRIGVEAGEVLVDMERASGPRDRMLTGDAVNTAARLQTAAEPGHVVVGPEAYAATKDVIEYRELPPLDLKGKAEPVLAWDALRIRAKQRGERARLGFGSSLVGRDEELAVLTQTLRRVQTEGRPALVTIVGPAGVGKSRLTAELNDHVDALPEFFYWRSGRCLAYGNTSYSALAGAIKAQCEILEDDPAEVAAAKADAAVRELFGDEAVAPQIRALVGAAGSETFTREQLFDAWRRFLERMAARYPLVLVLEDVHWADTGLLEFVEHAADWAQGPLMIVALARPELFDARPTWGGGKRNATSIYLDPLSTDEGATMVDELLGGSLPQELRTLIVERSEGNPLYVEEIVRKLIDEEVLRQRESGWTLTRPVGEIELPRSIQSLIAARLDGLPDDEKAVVQDAAVVGRVFWLGAVAELAGRETSLVRDALGRLRVKELVLPNDPPSFSDESEFTFKHVLIRDGAYESLPKSLRADKHAVVARWAEDRAGDRAGEIAELLATHTLASVRYRDQLGEHVGAELLRSAFEWSSSAGERAGSLWQLDEAERWFREALALGERLALPPTELAALARLHAEACWGVRSHHELELAVRHALELAEAAGDHRSTGYLLIKLSASLFQQGDDEQVVPLAEKGIARLEPFGDSSELSDALHWLGQYHWRRGRLEPAEVLLRRSADVAERTGAAREYAQAIHTLGIALTHGDRVQEGLELVEKSFVLAEETGEAGLLMRIYNNLPSTIMGVSSDLRRAEELLREGIDLAARVGAVANRAWMLGTLGDVLGSFGSLPEAEARQREAAALAEQVADEPLRGMRINGLAWTVLQRGRIDEAAQLAEESSVVQRDNPEPQSEVFVHGLNGAIASARGYHEGAIGSLRRGAELRRRFRLDQEHPMLLLLVRTFLAVGRPGEAASYRDMWERDRSPSGRAAAAAIEGMLAEEPAAAVAHLREAAAGFEATGERIELAQVLIDLGRAMRRAGQDPRAEFERARDLVIACDALLYLPAIEAELAEAYIEPT